MHQSLTALQSNANGERLNMVLSAMNNIAQANYAEALTDLIDIIIANPSDDDDQTTENARIVFTEVMAVVEQSYQLPQFAGQFLLIYAKKIGVESTKDIDTAVLTANAFIKGGTDVHTSLVLAVDVLYEALEKQI